MQHSDIVQKWLEYNPKIIIKELIRAGANVNERNNMGVSPLVIAASMEPLLLLIAKSRSKPEQYQ